MAGTFQNVTSYEIDQIVRYSCIKPGFTPVPNDTLVCEFKNGVAQWSGTPPTCEGNCFKFFIFKFTLMRQNIKITTISSDSYYVLGMYLQIKILSEREFHCMLGCLRKSILYFLENNFLVEI